MFFFFRCGEQESKIDPTLAVSSIDTMFVTAASELLGDTKMEVDQVS